MVLNVTIPVGKSPEDLPLGIKNNNPGNLRPYDGELYAGSSDIKDDFIIFDSAENGLRGLSRDIQTRCLFYISCNNFMLNQQCLI